MTLSYDVGRISGILKQLYVGKSVPDAIGYHTKIFKLFEKTSVKAMGGVVATSDSADAGWGTLKFPIRLGRNEHVASGGVDSYFQTGSTMVIRQANTALTFNLFSDTMLIAELETAIENGSFVNSMEMRRDGTLETVVDQMDRQVMSNKLGTILNIASTTYTVDTNKFLRNRMLVDTYTSTSSSCTSKTVSAVDRDSIPGQIKCTLSAGTGTTLVGDDIYIHGSYGYEITPLAKAISGANDLDTANTTDAYEGITSSTDTEWCAPTFNAGGPFDFTKHFVVPVTEVDARSRYNVNLLITTPEILGDIMARYTMQLRRNFNGQIIPVTKGDISFNLEGLEWTNPFSGQPCALIGSQHCPKGHFYGLSLKTNTNEPNWFITETRKPYFIPGTVGGILHLAREVSNGPHPAYDMFGYYFTQLACRNRAGNFKVFGITVP